MALSKYKLKLKPKPGGNTTGEKDQTTWTQDEQPTLSHILHKFQETFGIDKQARFYIDYEGGLETLNSCLVSKIAHEQTIYYSQNGETFIDKLSS